MLRISKPAAIPILFLTESAHFHAPKGPIFTSCHRGRCSRLHLTVRICAFGTGTYFRVVHTVHIYLIHPLIIDIVTGHRCSVCIVLIVCISALIVFCWELIQRASVYSPLSHPPTSSSRSHLSVSFGASCVVPGRRGYFR